MTVQQARIVFASHMQAARSRKLNAYEKNQLSQARQVLRHSRKPAMNPTTSTTDPRYQTGFDEGYLGYEMSDRSEQYKKGYIQGVRYRDKRTRKTKLKSVKSNPGKPVLIYQHVDRIYATKGPGHICDPECAKNGHRYFHDFKTRPKMYGLPDGSILIKS